MQSLPKWCYQASRLPYLSWNYPSVSPSYILFLSHLYAYQVKDVYLLFIVYREVLLRWNVKIFKCIFFDPSDIFPPEGGSCCK